MAVDQKTGAKLEQTQDVNALADLTAKRNPLAKAVPAVPTTIESRSGRWPAPRIVGAEEVQQARHRVPWIWRHYKGLLFWLIVALPTAAGAVYYFFLSSPQYVTEFHMGIRMADPTALATSSFSSGGLASGSSVAGGSALGATLIGLESYVVVDYISSGEMAESLNKTMNLSGKYSSHSIDFWSRLPEEAPKESLAYYWANMIDGYFDLTTGAILVKVRAFSPQDSLAIANAVIDAAIARVSEMREQARADELRGAESDLAKAEARVTKTRQELNDIRDREGMFDPQQRVGAVSSTGDFLRNDIAQVQALLRADSQLMSPNAPTLPVLRQRIAAEQEQLRQIDASIASKGRSDKSGDLSAVVHRFNEAQSVENFAELAYQNAQQSLDVARTTADREQLFLVNYVKPSRPQISLYPNKTKAIGTIGAFSFIAWFIMIIAIASLREHKL